VNKREVEPILLLEMANDSVSLLIHERVWLGLACPGPIHICKGVFGKVGLGPLSGISIHGPETSIYDVTAALRRKFLLSV